MTTMNLPSDDVGATLERINDARGQQYGEIILLGTDTSTGHHPLCQDHVRQLEVSGSQQRA